LVEAIEDQVSPVDFLTSLRA